MTNDHRYFSRRCADYDQDQAFAQRPIDSVMEMACNHFLSLVGVCLDYYGCDQADNTFKVDEIVFKVLEDPEDGYRSCLGTMDYTKPHRDRPTSIFYKHPIATVRVVPFNEEPIKGDKYAGHRGDRKGYRLLDMEDDHCWLEFGTDYYDDYYPYFVFSHTPKIKA